MQFPNYFEIYNTVDLHFNLWYKSKFDKSYHMVGIEDTVAQRYEFVFVLCLHSTCPDIHFVCLHTVHGTCISKTFSCLLNLSLSDQCLHLFILLYMYNGQAVEMFVLFVMSI